MKKKFLAILIITGVFTTTASALDDKIIGYGIATIAFIKNAIDSNNKKVSKKKKRSHKKRVKKKSKKHYSKKKTVHKKRKTVKKKTVKKTKVAKAPAVKKEIVKKEVSPIKIVNIDKQKKAASAKIELAGAPIVKETPKKITSVAAKAAPAEKKYW